MPAAYIEIESAVESVTVFKPAADHQSHLATATTAESFAYAGDVRPKSIQGWGIVRKEIECRACGGKLATSTAEIKPTCGFCGTSNVIQHQAPEDALRPHDILPFALDESGIRVKLRRWAGAGGWLTPSSLKTAAATGAITPIYLPFWLFEAQARATWQAEVGADQTVSTAGRGQTVTSWTHSEGSVEHQFEDILINGSLHIDAAEFGRIATYDLHSLVPYDVKYLSHTRAQTYELSQEKAWLKARHQMRDIVKQKSKATIKGSDIQNFTLSVDFQDEAWRYVLMPLYVLNYDHNNQAQRLLINGQTGEIAGSRPVAWSKVLWAGALPMLLGTALMLYQWFLGMSDGNLLNIMAALLFGVGVLLACLLGYKALGMSHA